MTARRAGATAVALTLLAVSVLLLMVMFAARSGPQRIFAGPLHDPVVHGVAPSYTPPTFGAGGNPLPGRGGHESSLLRILGILLEVAFFACLAWLLFLGGRALAERLRHLRWRRRSRAPAPAPVEFEVLDDPDALVAELRRGADEQLDLLLGGAPRNAIVAAWDRFEDYAERAHASRLPWETSSEFTLRLLDLVSADDRAVARLEGLYREARFSEHEIDEARREAAVEALQAIHASLGLEVRQP